EAGDARQYAKGGVGPAQRRIGGRYYGFSRFVGSTHKYIIRRRWACWTTLAQIAKDVLNKPAREMRHFPGTPASPDVAESLPDYLARIHLSTPRVSPFVRPNASHQPSKISSNSSGRSTDGSVASRYGCLSCRVIRSNRPLRRAKCCS